MGWSTADIPDLSDRVVVVTGANGGLGFETSRELVRHGAHVVMAARDLDRCAAARERISREVMARQLHDASLEQVELDLASLASVRAAATTILEAHPVIDILVDNAGVMAIPYRTTRDGFETQFGVNHLGHFALTALLMPAILRAERGRVVTVTSTGRFLGSTVDPADPTMATRYGAWRAYGRSKLANLQFAIELDRRVKAAGGRAIAASADPGFSRTGLQVTSAREQPGISQRFFEAAVAFGGATPARGAMPQLRAATDPSVRGGELFALRFLMGGSPVRFPYLSRSLRPRDLATLWSVSERETGVPFDVEAMVRATA